MIMLASCAHDGLPDGALNFSGVDPALTVQPTQVMVLGTVHLSRHDDTLSQNDLEPLIERLAAYRPDVITVENSSGMTCHRARAFVREHEGYAENYCFDGAPFRKESGLSVAEASFQARQALSDWPEAPTAAQRRALAAAFIASEDPDSALVQWLRLNEADRMARDGLGPQSVALLNARSGSLNESRSIAARLAARLGLERVFPADDHGSYFRTEDDQAAYGARIETLWRGDGEPCGAHVEAAKAKLTGGDLLGAYRDYNSVDYQRGQMECDWTRTMNDSEPDRYGRQYTMGWQARNLRMVSLIMDAAKTDPGGRVLSIVGVSHKPYFEAYLDQMHDVEIVSTDTVLKSP